MNGWEQFCLGFKDFMNQPVPIIGCTIGFLLFFVLTIIAKTSIGKKAFNKVKELNEKLANENEELQKANVEIKKEYNAFKNEKEQELEQLKNDYEIKLGGYVKALNGQNEMIKVLCENNVNKNVKQAYEHYSCEIKDLNVSESINNIKEQAKEEVETLYDEKIENLQKQVERLEELYEEKEHINDKTSE